MPMFFTYVSYPFPLGSHLNDAHRAHVGFGFVGLFVGVCMCVGVGVWVFIILYTTVSFSSFVNKMPSVHWC